MNSIANRFCSATVLVIGDVMLDEFCCRIRLADLPGSAGTRLDIRSRYSSPGGAANVAMNVAGLGSTVHLVGLAGRDAAGLTLRRLLRERSITDRNLIDPGDRGTISKTRM